MRAYEGQFNNPDGTVIPVWVRESHGTKWGWEDRISRPRGFEDCFYQIRGIGKCTTLKEKCEKLVPSKKARKAVAAAQQAERQRRAARGREPINPPGPAREQAWREAVERRKRLREEKAKALFEKKRLRACRDYESCITRGDLRVLRNDQWVCPLHGETHAAHYVKNPNLDWENMD